MSSVQGNWFDCFLGRVIGSLCSYLISWPVKITFLFLLFPFHTFVYAQCPEEGKPNPYVFLQVYKVTNDEDGDKYELKGEATGVLISDKGLILSDYALLRSVDKDEKKAGSIRLGEDVFIYAFKNPPVIADLNSLTEEYEVSLVNYHKRRGLLLFEMNIAAMGDMEERGFVSAKLMEGMKQAGKLKSCVATYEKNGLNKYKVKLYDDLRLGGFQGGFLVELEGLDLKDRAWGSPVFLDNTEQLMGIISSSEADFEHMVPIEFADSLLPQVFLSELKDKFDPVEKSYREHSIRWEIISGKNALMCVKFSKIIEGPPYLAKKTTFKFIFTMENGGRPEIVIENPDVPDKEEMYLFQRDVSQFCFGLNVMEKLKTEISKFDKSTFIKSAELEIRPQASWYSKVGGGVTEPLTTIRQDIDQKMLCNLLINTGQEKWLKDVSERCGK